jgi:hypothetical protein
LILGLKWCSGCGRRKREARLKLSSANGDFPCSLSSNPSPERIDESVLGKSPLEKSISVLLEYAIVLE